jgi:hypothetical protein
MTPPGPPTVTWNSAAFTGRTTRRLSNAEVAMDLESIISVCTSVRQIK